MIEIDKFLIEEGVDIDSILIYYDDKPILMMYKGELYCESYYLYFSIDKRDVIIGVDELL